MKTDVLRMYYRRDRRQSGAGRQAVTQAAMPRRSGRPTGKRRSSGRMYARGEGHPRARRSTEVAAACELVAASVYSERQIAFKGKA
jgi:hypothetical protein